MEQHLVLGNSKPDACLRIHFYMDTKEEKSPFQVPATRRSRLSQDAGLVILGDLSIQGNIKPMRSLAEPLQVAMDNGARKALIPLENKRNLLEVSGEIVERVDPVFFSDPMTVAMKGLGIT